jgi:hypothetical protein
METLYVASGDAPRVQIPAYRTLGVRVRPAGGDGVLLSGGAVDTTPTLPGQHALLRAIATTEAERGPIAVTRAAAAGALTAWARGRALGAWVDAGELRVEALDGGTLRVEAAAHGVRRAQTMACALPDGHWHLLQLRWGDGAPGVWVDGVRCDAPDAWAATTEAEPALGPLRLGPVDPPPPPDWEHPGALATHGIESVGTTWSDTGYTAAAEVDGVGDVLRTAQLRLARASPQALTLTDLMGVADAPADAERDGDALRVPCAAGPLLCAVRVDRLGRVALYVDGVRALEYTAARAAPAGPATFGGGGLIDVLRPRLWRRLLTPAQLAAARGDLAWADARVYGAAVPLAEPARGALPDPDPAPPPRAWRLATAGGALTLDGAPLGAAPRAGAWSHLALRFAPERLDVLLDGAVVGGDAALAAPAPIAETLTLGAVAREGRDVHHAPAAPRVHEVAGVAVHAALAVYFETTVWRQWYGLTGAAGARAAVAWDADVALAVLNEGDALAAVAGASLAPGDFLVARRADARALPHHAADDGGAWAFPFPVRVQRAFPEGAAPLGVARRVPVGAAPVRLYGAPDGVSGAAFLLGEARGRAAGPLRAFFAADADAPRAELVWSSADGGVTVPRDGLSVGADLALRGDRLGRAYDAAPEPAAVLAAYYAQPTRRYLRADGALRVRTQWGVVHDVPYLADDPAYDADGAAEAHAVWVGGAHFDDAQTADVAAVHLPATTAPDGGHADAEPWQYFDLFASAAALPEAEVRKAVDAPVAESDGVARTARLSMFLPEADYAWGDGAAFHSEALTLRPGDANQFEAQVTVPENAARVVVALHADEPLAVQELTLTPGPRPAAQAAALTLYEPAAAGDPFHAFKHGVFPAVDVMEGATYRIDCADCTERVYIATAPGSAARFLPSLLFPPQSDDLLRYDGRSAAPDEAAAGGAGSSILFTVPWGTADAHEALYYRTDATGGGALRVFPGAAYGGWRFPVPLAPFERPDDAQRLAYRRVHDTVELVGGARATAAIDAPRTVAVLPPGYRPAFTCYGHAVCVDAAHAAATVRVEPSGAVQLLPAPGRRFAVARVAFPVERVDQPPAVFPVQEVRYEVRFVAVFGVEAAVFRAAYQDAYAAAVAAACGTTAEHVVLDVRTGSSVVDTRVRDVPDGDAAVQLIDAGLQAALQAHSADAGEAALLADLGEAAVSGLGAVSYDASVAYTEAVAALRFAAHSGDAVTDVVATLVPAEGDAVPAAVAGDVATVAWFDALALPPWRFGVQVFSEQGASALRLTEPFGPVEPAPVAALAPVHYGDGAVRVAWAAPDAGGLAIQRYEVARDDGAVVVAALEDAAVPWAALPMTLRVDTVTRWNLVAGRATAGAAVVVPRPPLALAAETRAPATADVALLRVAVDAGGLRVTPALALVNQRDGAREPVPLAAGRYLDAPLQLRVQPGTTYLLELAATSTAHAEATQALQFATPDHAWVETGAVQYAFHHDGGAQTYAQTDMPLPDGGGSYTNRVFDEASATHTYVHRFWCRSVAGPDGCAPPTQVRLLGRRAPDEPYALLCAVDDVPHDLSDAPWGAEGVEAPGDGEGAREVHTADGGPYRYLRVEADVVGNARVAWQADYRRAAVSGAPAAARLVTLRVDPATLALEARFARERPDTDAVEWSVGAAVYDQTLAPGEDTARGVAAYGAQTLHWRVRAPGAAEPAHADARAFDAPFDPLRAFAPAVGARADARFTYAGGAAVPRAVTYAAPGFYSARTSALITPDLGGDHWLPEVYGVAFDGAAVRRGVPPATAGAPTSVLAWALDGLPIVDPAAAAGAAPDACNGAQVVLPEYAEPVYAYLGHAARFRGVPDLDTAP